MFVGTSLLHIICNCMYNGPYNPHPRIGCIYKLVWVGVFWCPINKNSNGSPERELVIRNVTEREKRHSREPRPVIKSRTSLTPAIDTIIILLWELFT